MEKANLLDPPGKEGLPNCYWPPFCSQTHKLLRQDMNFLVTQHCSPLLQSLVLVSSIKFTYNFYQLISSGPLHQYLFLGKSL